MPIRLIDEDTPADNTPAPPKRPGRALLIGAVVIALIATGIAIWALTRPGNITADPTTKTPAGTAGTVTADPDGNGEPLAPTDGQIDGVAGLYQGTATITLGNNSAVYGVRTGWEKTTNGAIAAAMNYEAADRQLVTLLPATKNTVQKRIYTESGLKTSATPDSVASTWRKMASINEQGDVVRNGKVSPEERAYVDAFPRFGAYRVIEIQGKRLSPDFVTVQIWYPFVYGPGTVDNLTDVKVGFTRTQMDMVWNTTVGDWQLNVVAYDGEQPKPADARRTNQPRETIRRLLGSGWCVPADGTDQPYPGAVLTK